MNISVSQTHPVLLLLMLSVEINGLYEQKRKKIQDFKVLEKEFYENKEEAKKLRKSQSFKKKLEERRNTMEAFQHDM